MINVIESGDVYKIYFQYDKYLVDRIRAVPGRAWNADDKYWSIPKERLGFLLSQFRGTAYAYQVQVYNSEDIAENAEIDTTTDIPDVDISNVDFCVADGSEIFEHQKDFMRYAIGRQLAGYTSGFILADQQGIGKSLEVINLAMYNRKVHGLKHCLVISCVNSAKFNWYYEILKQTNGNETPYMLGSRKKRDGTIQLDTGSSENKLDDLKSGHMYGDPEAPELPFFLILNIEAMHMRVKKHYVMREQLVKMINAGEIGMIALDEFHRNCSAQSISGKQILQLKKSSKLPVEWIPMSGTPITKSPADLYVPLKLVGGHNYTKYYDWCQQFCIYGGFGNHKIIAYKNIPQLKGWLQANMLRRLKSEVLDLPPKIHSVEYVDNTPCQARLYAEVARELAMNKEDIENSLNPMERLLRLRQVNGSPELIDDSIKVDKTYYQKNAKLIRLMDLVKDIMANNEKVVIFSNWVEPLRMIYRFLAREYKVCVYTGTMNKDVREQQKQLFINNPEYKILIGTIPTLSESHTFTAANNVIFFDEPWNASTFEQCEDRCHRAGAIKTVNVYSIITRNTVDEYVRNIILTKDGVSKFIVDGNFDFRDNPKLLDMLLGYDGLGRQILPLLPGM